MQLNVIDHIDEQIYTDFNTPQGDDFEDIPLQVINRILFNEHPVKVFREYRRFSRGDLARRAGVTPGLIARIERGRMRAEREIMRRIAAALHVSLEEIA
ncbi:MAG: helix-turn-helix transcriptional regulator [Hyphomicrobiales bacterium]|nr:helix-turn-helix transcriptional regulator [Hyphomicrobiales bacterium]